MIKSTMKTAAIVLAAAISLVALGNSADAGGRTGSHRAGGYNSHGKGSHYYGGHTQLSPSKPASFQVAGHRCKDGSYSDSNGSGTCSHHGGEG